MWIDGWYLEDIAGWVGTGSQGGRWRAPSTGDSDLEVGILAGPDGCMVRFMTGLGEGIPRQHLEFKDLLQNASADDHVLTTTADLRPPHPRFRAGDSERSPNRARARCSASFADKDGQTSSAGASPSSLIL